MLDLNDSTFRTGDVGFAQFCGNKLKQLGNETRESNNTNNPWFLCMFVFSCLYWS